MNPALSILTDFLGGLGRATFFLFSTLAAVPASLRRPRVLTRQLYMAGSLSLIIIVVSGSFIGAVLALQSYRALVKFGAADSMGTLVALSIIRELGPVVTALLFAGRAGTAIAAEIGLMQATNQLSGMEMMAVDPMRRVVAPRFVAGVLSMPLLTAIFTVMSIGVTGAYFVGVTWIGIDGGAYWSQIRNNIDLGDLRDCLIKSLVFGVTVSWIAVYQGYHAAPNSEGVSSATTSTVVISSLAVLALDFVLTAIMFR